MADTKINDLPNKASPVGTDKFPIGSDEHVTLDQVASLSNAALTGAEVRDLLDALFGDAKWRQAEPLNAYAKTVAPTVNNDTLEGYGTGSFWFDETADKSYLCLDAAQGAAVWREAGVVQAALAAVALSGSAEDLTEGATKKLLTSSERTQLTDLPTDLAAKLDASKVQTMTAAAFAGASPDADQITFIIG